jgi:hypothetical protein
MEIVGVSLPAESYIFISCGIMLDHFIVVGNAVNCAVYLSVAMIGLFSKQLYITTSKFGRCFGNRLQVISTYSSLSLHFLLVLYYVSLFSISLVTDICFATCVLVSTCFIISSEGNCSCELVLLL